MTAAVSRQSVVPESLLLLPHRLCPAPSRRSAREIRYPAVVTQLWDDRAQYSSVIQHVLIQKKETGVSREVGDRYVCEECGAQLVYEKPCPCPGEKRHSEICCGGQMKKVVEKER